MKIIALLAVAFPISAAAATYTVPGVVEQSSGTIEPVSGTILADYPSVGATGEITYELSGADNDLLASHFSRTSPFWATASVGTWTASMGSQTNGTSVGRIFRTTGRLIIASPEFSAGDANETLVGVFRWILETEVATPLTTLGELRAEIESGNARLQFSLSGSVADEAVNFTMAEVAPVPLPASGLMLLAGLGGLAALRRKT